MTTQWAHLPNAAHIDRILVSLQEKPDHWDEEDVMQGNQWDKSWWAARHELLKQQRYAAWDAAWKAARTASHATRCSWSHTGYAAQNDAILALCAYDDCAYMLDSDPGELAILAAFGDNRAMLLLPACKAFHSIKELV